jgi:hypothetical protein
MMTYHLITFIGAALFGAGLMLAIAAFAIAIVTMTDCCDD